MIPQSTPSRTEGRSPTEGTIRRTGPDEIATTPHSELLIARARLKEALYLALQRVLEEINIRLGGSDYIGKPYERAITINPEGLIPDAIEQAIQRLATKLGFQGTSRIKALLGLESPLSVEALRDNEAFIREKLTAAGYLTPDGKPTRPA